MTVIAVTMTISSFIQGLGIELLSPLLSLIGFQGPTTTGRLAKIISALLHTAGLPMTIPTVLFLFLFLVIIENAFNYFEMSYSRKFIFDFVEKLRNDLFEVYLKAGWPYWLQIRLGPMTNRITEENLRVETAISSILVFLSNLILMAVLLGVAFVFSWPMALIFLTSGGLLVLMMDYRILRQTSSGPSISAQANDVQEVVQEHLNAAKLIKSSGLIESSLKTFKKVVRQLHAVQYEKWLQTYKATSIFNPLVISILCLGFYCAVGPLHIPQSKALVILLIYFRLAARLSGTRDIGHAIVLLSPSYEAILQDVRDAGVGDMRSKTPQRIALCLLPYHRALRFKTYHSLTNLEDRFYQI